jgi:hypothetical protein
MKAMANQDFLIALGAISGLTEQIQSIRTNLLLLQAFKQTIL